MWNFASKSKNQWNFPLYAKIQKFFNILMIYWLYISYFLSTKTQGASKTPINIIWLFINIEKKILNFSVFLKKNVIFFNFYFFRKKLMRTIWKLLGLGLNPSSTILVYASSFQNDNQTSSYCNAFFLRPGNMQGSQNVHRCVHMYTFMYICQLINKIKIAQVKTVNVRKKFNKIQ